MWVIFTGFYFYSHGRGSVTRWYFFLGFIRKNCQWYVWRKCRCWFHFWKMSIHLVPTWKMAHPIIIAYLNKRVTPVAKINAQYQSIYIIWYYQSLCEWTTSRTIGNFVVEYKLMNGCVGVERTFIVLSSNTLKVRGWNEWAQLELSNKPIQIDFIIMGLKYVLVNNLFWLLLALAWW